MIYAINTPSNTNTKTDLQELYYEFKLDLLRHEQEIFESITNQEYNLILNESNIDFRSGFKSIIDKLRNLIKRFLDFLDKMWVKMKAYIVKIISQYHTKIKEMKSTLKNMQKSSGNIHESVEDTDPYIILYKPALNPNYPVLVDDLYEKFRTIVTRIQSEYIDGLRNILEGKGGLDIIKRVYTLDDEIDLDLGVNKKYEQTSTLEKVIEDLLYLDETIEINIYNDKIIKELLESPIYRANSIIETVGISYGITKNAIKETNSVLENMLIKYAKDDSYHINEDDYMSFVNVITRLVDILLKKSDRMIAISNHTVLEGVIHAANTHKAILARRIEIEEQKSGIQQ